MYTLKIKIHIIEGLNILKSKRFEPMNNELNT